MPNLVKLDEIFPGLNLRVIQINRLFTAIQNSKRFFQRPFYKLELGGDEVRFDRAQVDPHFNLKLCKFRDFVNRRGKFVPRL